MVRIITDEAPVEELQRKLIEERIMLCKKAAVELGCTVEEIKYRVNNAGIYEFQKMTHQEMLQITANEEAQKNTIAIKKSRGVL